MNPGGLGKSFLQREDSLAFYFLHRASPQVPLQSPKNDSISNKERKRRSVGYTPYKIHRRAEVLSTVALLLKHQLNMTLRLFSEVEVVATLLLGVFNLNELSPAFIIMRSISISVRILDFFLTSYGR